MAHSDRAGGEEEGGMTPSEKRYLKRFTCGWCDQRLDRVERDGCAAMWEKCSQEVRQKRRENCLAARPVIGRRADG
jgi:hypothetical protein